MTRGMREATTESGGVPDNKKFSDTCLGTGKLNVKTGLEMQKRFEDKIGPGHRSFEDAILTLLGTGRPWLRIVTDKDIPDDLQPVGKHEYWTKGLGGERIWGYFFDLLKRIEAAKYGVFLDRDVNAALNILKCYRGDGFPCLQIILKYLHQNMFYQ